jgi:flagellar protein FliO/FliZ
MVSVVRTVVALLAVLAVMWLLARLVRRPARTAGGRRIDVVARTQLSRGAGIAVVRVGGRALLVGITDSQVTMLTEVDPDEVTVPEPRSDRTPVDLPAVPPSSAGSSSAGAGLAGSALSPRTWRQAVDALRERSVRRS